MPVVWPLVGRQEVLRRIAEAMRRPGCASGVLVGAVGVGKTRLAVEALDEAGRRGLDTLWTVATEAAASIPYGPVVDLLPQPDQERLPDEGHLTRADLLQRTIRSVDERRRGRGLVLGVDDAHLLDDASAALVHCLARTGTAQILATVRSGEQSADAVTALWKDDLAARVEIEPLGEDEAHQLVCAAVGGPVEGQTLRRLWGLSEGNPLFLRELVVEALETGTLVEVGGLWRGGAAMMVGTRLAELVEARIQRLDPGVRAGLEVVAVGEPLEAGLLEALSASMPTDARVTDAGWRRESPMETAERAGLVSVDVDRRRVRLRLAHPVYGEVLRATMPVLRARAIRRGLAEALQVTGCRRRDDLLRLASWRLEGGGHSDPDLLLAAALRARMLFDPALAARLAQAAVEAGAGFDASLIAAESLHMAGRAHDAEDLFSQLEPAARTEADLVRVALARVGNFVSFGRAGDAEAVVSRAEDVVADQDLRDELRAMRGMVALLQGRSQEALAAVLAVLDRPDASQRARVRALLVAVAAWAWTGATETAISTAEPLVTALERSDEQLREVVELLRFGLCFAYGVAGRLDDARTLATARYRASLDNLAHDLQPGWAAALGQVALSSGSARSAAGRLREAALLLRQESKAFGVYSLAWSLGCLAEAMALLGDLDAAQAALQEADAVTPEPCFVPNREVGRIWVAACGGAVVAARTTALDMAATARAHGSYAVEAFALHEAVRLGLAGEVADRLAVLADGVVDGRLVSAYAAHAVALVAGEGPALQKVSATFEELGAILIAAEAAAEAVRAYQREGRSASARTAAGRSQLLAERCEGCRTPGLERVILPQPLTVREREIAGLAAQGLSSQRIAERLVLSVRTVDNHLHHAYTKLGVSSRVELATVLSLRAG